MSAHVIKWSKRILFGLVGLFLAVWLIGAWLLRSWTAKPPPLPAGTSITQLRPQEREGKVWLGKSSLSRRGDLWVVHLKGSPFEMGYADGVLLREKMHTLEAEFLQMVEEYVPSRSTLTLLKWYVIYRNRHLSDFVPANYRTEIYGSTLGCPDSHPELGDYYNRMLNYHAAHDVSYMMIDNPFISRAGCTSFGVWGHKSADGHLITGRNFDWEAAEVFSRDRIVQLYEPDEGIPFISLSWAGMVGVVSGMNRAGVSVTINGAPSDLPKQTATPVAIVAREVLEKAHNLSEALEIVKGAQVFVSTLWLLGSKADNRFIVVEKTPTATQLREPEEDWIVCANHFQTANLREESRNKTYEAEATSLGREARLTELVSHTDKPVDVARAAAILRDRALAGGEFPGNGHRAALNALIATHATVMDLSTGIFWAASPPYQLGQFVAFDVKDFSHDLSELTVPPDPLLPSGEYERARQARQCLIDAKKALKKEEAQQALELASKAEELNPGFYQNAELKGRALEALGKPGEAKIAFETALRAKPAMAVERRELEKLLSGFHRN